MFPQKLFRVEAESRGLFSPFVITAESLFRRRRRRRDEAREGKMWYVLLKHVVCLTSGEEFTPTLNPSQIAGATILYTVRDSLVFIFTRKKFVDFEIAFTVHWGIVT